MSRIAEGHMTAAKGTVPLGKRLARTLIAVVSIGNARGDSGRGWGKYSLPPL